MKKIPGMEGALKHAKREAAALQKMAKHKATWNEGEAMKTERTAALMEALAAAHARIAEEMEYSAPLGRVEIAKAFYDECVRGYASVGAHLSQEQIDQVEAHAAGGRR